jgi:hypothetical protein
LGAGWRHLKEFQMRIEREVRETMPDLPPTHEIARMARSPARFLNSLAKMPEDQALKPDPGAPAPAPAADGGGTVSSGAGADPGSSRTPPLWVRDDPSMN